MYCICTAKSCILILLGMWRDFGGYDVSCDGCCIMFFVLSLILILCLCIK